MLNPLDVLQRTPKSNCGQCGYPTCLAFAAHVARSGEDPRKCPSLDAQGLPQPDNQAAALDRLAEKHDLTLIRQLREKIGPLDFARLAASLGLTLLPEEQLAFAYLGQMVRLSRRELLIDGREPEDPRDQILLYNYLHFGRNAGGPPSDTWIGLESLPNSISKIRTLATYCEDRLAQLFAGQPREAILALCARVGGRPATQSTATAAAIIPVLPRLPQQLLFWDEEPEEGFPAKVKVLFPANALDYLDLESLVFSSERLADRLLQLDAETP